MRFQICKKEIAISDTWARLFKSLCLITFSLLSEYAFWGFESFLHFVHRCPDRQLIAALLCPLTPAKDIGSSAAAVTQPRVSINFDSHSLSLTTFTPGQKIDHHWQCPSFRIFMLTFYIAFRLSQLPLASSGPFFSFLSSISDISGFLNLSF